MSEERVEAAYIISESALAELKKLAESTVWPKVTYSLDSQVMAEEAFGIVQSNARRILAICAEISKAMYAEISKEEV